MAKLKRTLGFWAITLSGIGIILGAGIYSVIGIAAASSGNGLWLSFAIAAIIALLTGLSFAELSSRFPTAGAEYVYAKKATGSKKIGFISGWFMILGSIIATSVVSISFGKYLFVVTGIDPLLSALALVVLSTFVIIWGIKESVTFAIVGSLIEAGGLILIIILGIPHFGSVDYLDFPPMGGIIAAAAIAFFAFIGFEDMVNMAEEVKNPVKNMPRALLLSVVISTILYILVAISSVSIVSWETLSQSGAPLATVAENTILGGAPLGLIALFATGNTVLLILIGSSRLLYGMAKRGMFPTFVKSVHKSRKTPWVAVILISLITVPLIVIGDLGIVAQMTNSLILLVFIIVNASAILLRYNEKTKKIHKKYFKMPLNIKWFPITAGLGLLSCIILLTGVDLMLVGLALSTIIPGLIIYEISSRSNN